MTDDRWTTEDRAFARLGALGKPSLAEQLEQLRIQQGIARTMHDVITRDAKHNPNHTVPPETTRPAGPAPVVTAGEPKPLELPPGQKEIEALADYFLPHGKGFKK
jgi:hypothetical protein